MSQAQPLKLRIAEKIVETPDACSIVFETNDAEPLVYRPGQFLTLNIPTDRAGGAARCYSLSSSPLLDEKPKITVKRTGPGYGSNWICDHLDAGDEIEVLRPSGTFTPRSLDTDLLLFAGGSGITPVMSILKSVLHAGSGRVALVYANRDEDSVIFRDELVALQKQFTARLQLVHLLESVQERPQVETLRELAVPYGDRTVFVCGPTPFMDAVTTAVTSAGVPPERVHHERFFTLTNDPFADARVELDAGGPAGTIEVTLDGETRTLSWPRNNRMLEVFLDAGLDAPFSCREGNCSACACFLLGGDVRMLRNEILEQADLDEGVVLACQAVPLSDWVRVSDDQ